MTYAKLDSTGAVERYPYRLADLAKDFLTTSFPENPSVELLKKFGVVPVLSAGRPAECHTKTVTEGAPLLVDGVWIQTWIEVDATPEEIAERTSLKASEVRSERNRRLTACDWTMLPDAEVDQAAWKAYRQALRNITQSPGFPWHFTWPTEPWSM